MSTRFGLVAASAVLALSATWTSARAAENALPTCPITGEAIDFNVKTMTEDGPAFFCCKKCIGAFEKDPAKFASAMAAQREALAKRDRVQVACPVTGEPVNAEVSVDYNGRKVSFCCKHCVAKFQADPEKFNAKLAASYTYQTKCPISGEGISPTTSAVLPSGDHIYTCCKKCASKIADAAEKVATSLAAQGYNFKVDDIKKAKLAEHEEEHEGADEDDDG